MPPLNTRIYPVQQKPTPPQSVWNANAPAPISGNITPLSPPGNPAPNRGLLPPEFMYDFATERFYPTGPQFVRGAVDTTTPVRNLALQAASAAGIKLT